MLLNFYCVYYLLKAASVLLHCHYFICEIYAKYLSQCICTNFVSKLNYFLTYVTKYHRLLVCYLLYQLIKQPLRFGKGHYLKYYTEAGERCLHTDIIVCARKLWFNIYMFILFIYGGGGGGE